MAQQKVPFMAGACIGVSLGAAEDDMAIPHPVAPVSA
jgi:hypothetical protein